MPGPGKKDPESSEDAEMADPSEGKFCLALAGSILEGILPGGGILTYLQRDVNVHCSRISVLAFEHETSLTK